MSSKRLRMSRALHLTSSLILTTSTGARAGGGVGGAVGTWPVPRCLSRQLSSFEPRRAVGTAWQWAMQAEEGQVPSHPRPP